MIPLAVTPVPSFTLSAGTVIWLPSGLIVIPLSAGAVQLPSWFFVTSTVVGASCPSGVYVTSTFVVSSGIVTPTVPSVFGVTTGLSGTTVIVTGVSTSLPRSSAGTSSPLP